MENEIRLIDANALKAKMRNTSRYFYIKYDIDEAPTVDAVPVVRCKDCKHYHTELGWCDVNSTFIKEHSEWRMFNDDDFCSYGERREGE